MFSNPHKPPLKTLSLFHKRAYMDEDIIVTLIKDSFYTHTRYIPYKIVQGDGKLLIFKEETLLYSKFIGETLTHIQILPC